MKKYWLDSYSSELYRRINGSLRRGGDVIAGVHQIDQALSKSEVPRDLIVYRGMDGFPVELLPGRGFRDKASVSTSISLAAARRFSGDEEFGPGRELVVRIRVPKGSKGAYLNAAGLGGSGEYELLLPRGLKFRVTGYHGDLIDVEIVK